MKIEWSQLEAAEVSKLVTGHTALKSALLKFCAAHAAHMQNECTHAMRSIPRQFELASDYAAKAEVYEAFMHQLETSSDQQV